MSTVNKRYVMLSVGVLTFLILLFWGIPQYRVWQQGLSGQAQLAEAEYSRKIAVQEAEAKRDSATLLAEAEIIRARGVAEANAIIGDSLKGNEAYLKYLWVETLSKGDKQVIYVPTETGLPLLEAGKRP